MNILSVDTSHKGRDTQAGVEIGNTKYQLSQQVIITLAHIDIIGITISQGGENGDMCKFH